MSPETTTKTTVQTTITDEPPARRKRGRRSPMTITQLQVILSRSIDDLIEGRTTAGTANAISNASGKILGTVKVEMEWMRLTGKKRHLSMLEDDQPKS